MALISINPANGEEIQRYEELPPETGHQRIAAAQQAFERWRGMDFPERAVCLTRAAKSLRSNRDAHARLMAREMGKPVKDGRAEMEKCAWVCDYFANHGSNMLRSETVETEARKSYVTFQPLGVILAVMPWNYPFWQVFRFAAPVLMAGNAGILKHAANVSGCALAIAEVFAEAGFPENLFQTLLVSSRGVEDLIGHPLIRGVSLTGSTEAGKSVAAAAGKYLKKVVLELGGSDPYLILEDAPLVETVRACVTSRLLNSGQSCIAAKRFIVVESVRKAFEERLVAALMEKKMGDPMDEDTDIGPQARPDLREDLHRQVRKSIEKGARCLLGGELPEGKGAFYPPTVLTDVAKGMPVYDEETFGPVAAVIPVKDEAEAVRVANDSSFGLGAAVFTDDLQRGERIASDSLEAGSCCVNTFVRSDPRLPFGGIKESGFGRELAHYGIREFVNIKTVYIE